MKRLPAKLKPAVDPGPRRNVLPDKPLDLPEVPKADEGPDAKLLQEIRDDYRHFKDYWRENREEMETCMRFAGGDAFTPDEHAFREGLDRPCETPDELSQYVKQTNNSLRQNKRDCKISPASELANGADAEKRESVLRGLNHRGDFQAAFQAAYECCTWCGFGYLGIAIRKGVDGHLEPGPRRLPNQFSVLLDPYAKKADYSDQKKCFVIDVMRKSDFALEYPKAQKRSFSADDAKIAPDWVLADEIVTAEYWRVEENGKVVQYITNGLEILDRIPWIGSWIPIIPILGEEIYVSEGGRIKRKYLSLISRARTPQKMLAFIASQELEEFGQAPRAPFIGYKGQFTSPDWATINTNPKTYIEVEAMPDPLNPGQVLPLPTRPQYQPNAAAYEMAREAWKRSVQAAVGVMPLPTPAQRQNQKSGIALERIANQEAVGSYHFVDNADRALVNYGRQMNELITKVMTKQRHVGIRNQDDTSGLMHLTTEAQGMPAGAMDEKQVLVVDRGEYDVTVTAGPSHESQREEASEFVDTLLANLKTLPIAPPIATKILSLAIKLKNIGPLGDQIAKLLDPEEGDPMQQAQKIMAQAAQQQQLLTELQGELQQLRLEKQGKVIDNEYKLRMEQLKTGADNYQAQLSNDIKVLTALITAKRGQEDQEHEMYKTFWLENHKAAHEAGLSAQEHAQTLEQGAHAAALAPQPDQTGATSEPAPQV